MGLSRGLPFWPSETAGSKSPFTFNVPRFKRTSEVLGALVVSSAAVLPPIAVLGLFYRRSRPSASGLDPEAVHGPGQYDFRDFVRVGGPLQLLLAVVTTVGIAGFWGL